MKRVFLAAAACLSLAVGAIGITSTPAAAGVTFSFQFGGPGPFYGQPFHPHPIYPQPFFGSPMFHSYPPAHRVCYPVVKVKKVIRHRRVHWRRIVVTVCRWQYGW